MLVGVRFGGLVLVGVRFGDLVLVGVRFGGLVLVGVRFGDLVLVGVRFGGLVLVGVRFGGLVVSVCILCSAIAACLMIHLTTSAGGTSGYVFGGVIGGVVFISCIVGITLLRVCLKLTAVRRRTQNVEAAPENYVSAGIGRRVTVVQRRIQPTNPDAPPPYVPSAEIESSDPPPYTAEPTNCPVPTSVEDTPTPQPLPPESPHSNPIEDPPEYLPPPGRDQDREPLLAEEQ